MSVAENVSDNRAAKLQAILKRVEIERRKLQKGEPFDESIKPDEVQTIVTSFNTPHHTLAFLVASTVLSFIREAYDGSKNLSNEEKNEKVAAIWFSTIDNAMQSTDSTIIRKALIVIQTTLQADVSAGTFLFLRDGMKEWLEDLPDLFSKDVPTVRSVSVLLALASGVPTCRPVISANFQPWLRSNARTSGDVMTRSSSAVALTKLSRGAALGDDDEVSPEGGMWNVGASQEQKQEEARHRAAQDAELTSLMKGLVISESEEEDVSPTLDAVEGLAYLSNEPLLKESLSTDESFLKHLVSLIPTTQKHNNLISRQIDESPSAKTSTALVYGISTIIANLVSYPIRLTGEDAQIDKLRRMARAGGAGSAGRLQEPAELEELQEKDEVVAARGKRLIKAGVLPILAVMAKSESPLARRQVSKAYLALVEPKENRGLVLQAGGSKALGFLARAGTLPVRSDGEPLPLLTSDRSSDFRKRTKEDLIPIQALAKLSITTSPRLVFGTSQPEIIDAIQPFHFIVLFPDSSLLQQFEGLMALTNLASISADAAERVATVELAAKLEVLMLDDNTLVRRAATELVCNIITTDAILPRYGGAPSPGQNEKEKEKEGSKTVPPPAIVSRLHVLLGLSDVDDVRTQLAASGALATLLGISPTGVLALLNVPKGPKGVFAILGDIIDPSSLDGEEGETAYSNVETQPTEGELLQLAHRGAVCIWGILSTVEKSGKEMEESVVKAADEERLVSALVTLIKPLMATEARNQPGPRQIIISAAQSLQWLSNHGLDVKQ